MDPMCFLHLVYNCNANTTISPSFPETSLTFLNPESSQDLSELSITLVTSSGTQNDLVVFLMGFHVVST